MKKTFKGWVVIQSKTGSDWGHQKEWPVISDIFDTKKEANEWLNGVIGKLSCCPIDFRKIYK